MFVSIKKRADKLLLEVIQKRFIKGTLFLYSKGKYIAFSVDKNKIEVYLSDDFKYYNDYFICFSGENVKYVGGRGDVGDVKLIMNNFEKIGKTERKNNLIEGINQDRNKVTDEIMHKMFGFLPVGFYELARKQLYDLFSSCKRAVELESLIPYSKFIEVGMAEDKTFVGVVYKNNLPFAIAIGFNAQINKNNLIHENSYQYFYKNGRELKGYFLSFRRASDGDVVWI